MAQYLVDIPPQIIEASPVLSTLNNTKDTHLPCPIPVEAVKAFIEVDAVTWVPDFFVACRFYCIEGVESAVRSWVRLHGDEEGAAAKVKMAVEGGCDVGEVMEWFEEMKEEYCYEQGLLFRVRDKDVSLLMRKFAAHGWLWIVRHLVEECHGDVTANDNETVEWASSRGHLAVVRYLVECGADPTVHDNRCVRLASQSGHLAVVRYLVEECGADPTTESNEALTNASRNGHLPVVRYLVEDCVVNAGITGKNTALQVASRDGHLEVVRYLVECGADPTTLNHWAVRMASRYGYLELVQYLVGECDAGDVASGSCSYWLAKRYGHVEVEQYLFEAYSAKYSAMCNDNDDDN